MSGMRWIPGSFVFVSLALHAGAQGVSPVVGGAGSFGGPGLPAGREPAAQGSPFDIQPPSGAPLARLTAAEQERFEQGAFFYVSAPPAAGPNLNQFTCGVCHNNPTGGFGQSKVTHFGRFDGPDFDPLDELGGTLLQAISLGGCNEVIPPEANTFFLRATPGAMGYGLIEAIPDADLLALEANPPSPLVSGRAQMVVPLEGGPPRVGRFGWKSTVATILSFSADAARNELGFTNRLLPTEPPPNGNPNTFGLCDFDPDPEDGPQAGNGIDFIDRITDFQRLMAAPPQTPRAGMAGEAVFASIGCADCHVPTLRTVDDPALEYAIRDREIHPYSDFLLHDMGELADFPQGAASASEFRTTPLWGLRRRIFLLHDGRVFGKPFAGLMDDVVAWHGAPGSEAAPAAQAWAALAPEERAQVVAFLGSLGRREFDYDGNDKVNDADLVAFRRCTEVGGPITPDSPCAVFDLDADGDLDLYDYAGMLEVLE